MNDRAKKNIKYNRDLLKRLPQEYDNIRWLMAWRKGAVYRFMLKLYQYVDKNNLVATDQGRDLFWIAGEYMQRHFGTTKGQYYISYLSCVGLLDKVMPGHKAGRNRPAWETFTDQGDVFSAQWWINHVSMQMNQRQRQVDGITFKKNISVYVLPKLTKERLQWADDRIGVYRDRGVMPGNVSFDLLYAVGLSYDADRVFFQKDKKGTAHLFTFKVAYIQRVVENMVKEKGYATKSDVFTQIGGRYSEYSLTQAWRYFIHDPYCEYVFHRPSECEVDRYGLTSHKYIVTPKLVHA